MLTLKNHNWGIRGEDYSRHCCANLHQYDRQLKELALLWGSPQTNYKDNTDFQIFSANIALYNQKQSLILVIRPPLLLSIFLYTIDIDIPTDIYCYNIYIQYAPSPCHTRHTFSLASLALAYCHYIQNHELCKNEKWSSFQNKLSPAFLGAGLVK